MSVMQKIRILDLLDTYQKMGARFTKQNRPVRILWTQEFSTEIEAAKREKQIKGWGRKKKENLIKGIWK